MAPISSCPQCVNSIINSVILIIFDKICLQKANYDDIVYENVINSNAEYPERKVNMNPNHGFTKTVALSNAP